MAAVFTPITPRAAPVRTTGAVAWVKKNLFGNPLSAVVTVVMILLALWSIPALFSWAVVNAVVRPDAEDEVLGLLAHHGEAPAVIGEIVAGAGGAMRVTTIGQLQHG